MRLLTISILCLCTVLFSNSYAGTIEGRITDSLSNPLPFCNVYLKQTGYAAVSNEMGYYKLQAPPGNYTIIFQYIGYQKLELPVEITSTPVHLDVVLQEELTELQEIVVHANKEDPAYAIIRQAIDLRETHLKEIAGFTCNVYMKGLQKLLEAPDQLLGVKLNTVLDVDSNNTGIVYLSESSSTFHVNYPDKTKEIMHASVVSGDNSSFSWNDAASMQMNFYQNLETLEGFSQRGFVSPVADNALFFYSYHLLSSRMDDGHEIFKIEVTPKRATDPAYKGTLYITDDDYRIAGLQLMLTKDNGIEFLDTFRVEQEYFYPDREHLVLLSNKFSFNYNFLGIRGQGYFHAYYSNYTINPVFPAKFFSGEVTKIESGANKQDSLYWSSIRPMKLTEEEVSDYTEKDALALLKETPAYRDSVDKEFNAFRWSHIIGGYVYRNSNKDIFISTNPVFDVLQYNTVEGYVIQPRISVTKKITPRKEIVYQSAVRYNTAANGILLNGSVTYRYNPFNKGRISVSGGSGVRQYNTNGIVPLFNTAYSLLAEENYLKLYGREYIQLEAEQEIFTNGLFLGTGLTYANRYRLHNMQNAEAWINDNSVSFTPNNTFSTFTGQFEANGPLPDKLTIHLDARYVIRQTYMTQPDEKYIFESKYPVLRFRTEWNYGTSISTPYQYAMLDFQIQDVIKLNLAGSLDYELRTSWQFTNDSLDIADFLHAPGNATIFSRMTDGGFFLLPYYFASNDSGLHTAKVQWHTDGFLFRKLPLFKQLKLEPVFSANFLRTNSIGLYSEYAIGIEHLFKILRIDLAYTPYKNDAYPELPEFRVLLGFGF